MPPSQLPRIAVSMGDPSGVGPELCCRIAADPSLKQQAHIEIFGPGWLLERVAERCGLALPSCIHDCGEAATDAIQPGVISRESGQTAWTALDAALDACLSGSHQALVTAPVNKAALQAAGFRHPGHTEYLAARCGKARVAMALSGPELTVALATTHCALREVPSLLNTQQVVEVGTLLDQALRQRHQRAVHIACLGLNPHAGEGGLFGDEEERILLPAIQQLRAAGCQISDPLPPDTAFIPAVREQYDGFLCAYHDQGLIPFKMLHFADGVNWTLGLPIIRTSPDHGSAFDRAWQGSASPSSLHAATTLAISLARQRHQSVL